MDLALDSTTKNPPFFVSLKVVQSRHVSVLIRPLPWGVMCFVCYHIYILPLSSNNTIESLIYSLTLAPSFPFLQTYNLQTATRLLLYLFAKLYTSSKQNAGSTSHRQICTLVGSFRVEVEELWEKGGTQSTYPWSKSISRVTKRAHINDRELH